MPEPADVMVSDVSTTAGSWHDSAVTTLKFDRVVVDLPSNRASKLRRLNVAAGILHLVTAAVMVAVGNRSFSLPVSGFNIGGPPGTDLSDGVLSELFSVPLAWSVAAFSLLSALFHFLIAGPSFGQYCQELERGRNRFRWVEYALSSTLMMVLIAMTTGVTDLAALIAIGFANVAMILFGWIMEMVNDPDGDVWWSPFWFGCVAGIGPWAAIIGALVFNLSQEGAEGPPGFVYGIIVTIFLFFNCFAINQWLQYRRIGKWTDYLHGERTYIVLSFVAKSVLAWQVFANTLIE
jgi:hypothetical protein